MKIWHISDTHGYHDMLTVPENIDIAIHSGDCSNPINPYNNEPEVRQFIDWYKELPIKYKIYVAGNHDSSIEKKLVTEKDFFNNDIIYLEDDYIHIEGLKIHGSPVTPNFGNWCFMKDRSKLDKHWQRTIEDDVDILVVHGPPKGILDISDTREHTIENCGCNALKRHVLTRIKPKLMLFGHIHNNDDNINAGTMKLSAYDTIFSNGSVVTDRRFGKLTSNGNILEI
jgi:Icc-related predicted phosphoesterase